MNHLNLKKNRKSYFDNNVKAQFNLIESIAEFKVTKNFIYGSSSSVYGEKSNQTETFNIEKQESYNIMVYIISKIIFKL